MKKIGKYQISEILGKGAMGIVYKALDPDINREVAIKTIRFDLISEESEREELMRRFIREAQAAGKLVHPNIITVYDVGREEDLTYIVMQYVEGQSLQKKIALGKKFSHQEIINLMSHLCNALDYAHQNEIVHRDIKPANILMDKKGKPFIVDFGVARIETSTLTQTGTTIGTPSYMSPEQVMGKKVDKRSDIFSLGVILYELLTGKRPFYGESITTVIYKIINEQPPALSELRKGLPTGFEYVINKTLAKDSKNRYKACSELYTDLHNLSELPDWSLALEATQEKLKIFKKKRKLRLALILACSFAAILMAGGGGALFLSQEARSIIFPPKKTQEKKVEETSLPSPSKDVTQNIREDKINKVRESLEKGEYAEAIKLAEGILSEDSNNITAREYLDRAKREINEALIAQNLEEGISSYNRGNYKLCKLTMEKILNLDKENKEAKRYLYLADTAVSKKEILQILERQRKAEEEKDLLSILGDISSPSLSNQRKADAVLLFNYYDEITSRISNISVRFKNRNHADVSFSHILTALYKRTGQKKVLFEGVKTWVFKKHGKAWKIIDFK